MNNKNKKEERKNLEIISVLLISLSLISLSVFVVAVPTGPDSILFYNNTTKTTTSALIVNVSGGVISKFNISATTQNDNWKAFVGDVIGTFTLDDAGGSTIYDWTLGSVSGEVYATRTSGSVSWSQIACANLANITNEENVMIHTGSDNITNTFNNTNTGAMITAGTTITGGSCSYSLFTYISDAYQEVDFETIALMDNTNIVYATNLEEDTIGFDGTRFDFQMLVPENASETFTGATAYYLYVELS